MTKYCTASVRILSVLVKAIALAISHNALAELASGRPNTIGTSRSPHQTAIALTYR